MIILSATVHGLPVYALSCHFTSYHYDLNFLIRFLAFFFVHGWEVLLQIKLIFVRVPQVMGVSITGVIVF